MLYFCLIWTYPGDFFKISAALFFMNLTCIWNRISLTWEKNHQNRKLEKKTDQSWSVAAVFGKIICAIKIRLPSHPRADLTAAEMIASSITESYSQLLSVKERKSA